MVLNMKKRKGFTLIELLIVIIIIGILAGMMMMTMGSATDKAQATKVISDIRTVKSAVTMWYADNMSSTALPTAANLSKYMDTSLDASFKEVTSKNITIDNSTQEAWWLEYDLKGVANTTGVRQKLSDDAINVGLYGSSVPTDISKGYYSGADEKIFVRVR